MRYEDFTIRSRADLFYWRGWQKARGTFDLAPLGALLFSRREIGVYLDALLSAEKPVPQALSNLAGQIDALDAMIMCRRVTAFGGWYCGETIEGPR